MGTTFLCGWKHILCCLISPSLIIPPARAGWGSQAQQGTVVELLNQPGLSFIGMTTNHVKSEADRRRKRFRLTHQHDYLLEKSRFVSQLKCWLRKRFKYEKRKKEKKPTMFSHLLINAAGQSVTVGGIAQKKFITWGYLKCLKCATATPNPFAHTFTFPNHRGIDAVWFAHHNSSRLVFARWFCADALYNSWPQWPCEHRQVWLQTTWLRHNIWSMT